MSTISNDNQQGKGSISRTVLVILALIFINPIGLVLMLTMSRWKKWIKILIIILLFPFYVVWIINISNFIWRFKDDRQFFYSAQIKEIANWKTYKNAKYGYSIKYPPDWTAGDGWFTAPGGQQGYSYSDIYVLVLPKAIYVDNINREKVSLEEYVKKYASKETDPNKTAISIKKITTFQSKVMGFAVEWEASGWSMNKKNYSVYFELPNDKTSTLQIDGIEGRHMDIYNKMVSTFNFSQ